MNAAIGAARGIAIAGLATAIVSGAVLAFALRATALTHPGELEDLSGYRID